MLGHGLSLGVSDSDLVVQALLDGLDEVSLSVEVLAEAYGPLSSFAALG